MALARSSGPNFEAVEPRPWRMMNVCLCDSAGGTVRGFGYVGFVRRDVVAVVPDILHYASLVES
jgi:hypothetical protein